MFSALIDEKQPIGERRMEIDDFSLRLPFNKLIVDGLLRRGASNIVARAAEGQFQQVVRIDIRPLRKVGDEGGAAAEAPFRVEVEMGGEF